MVRRLNAKGVRAGGLARWEGDHAEVMKESAFGRAPRAMAEFGLVFAGVLVPD